VAEASSMVNMSLSNDQKAKIQKHLFSTEKLQSDINGKSLTTSFHPHHPHHTNSQTPAFPRYRMQRRSRKRKHSIAQNKYSDNHSISVPGLLVYLSTKD
jgi:hypothetical protein